MFEKLENRRMFSVTASVDVNADILTIVGNEAADSVRVLKTNATTVRVEDLTTAQVFDFLASEVSSIRFEGAAGNDRFELVAGTGTRRLNVPVTALGGIGNDTMISAGGDDRLEGEAGSDSLVSGDGADSLFGGTQNDVIDAGAGDDFVDGGAGADQMQAGAGTDTVDYSARIARVSVDLRGQGFGRGIIRPTFHGEALERDTLAGFENANGGAGSDILTGSSAVNRIFGNGGNDKIKGLGGNDDLFAGPGNDTVSGAEGRDDIEGGSGNDLLLGGADNDAIDGEANNDTLIGGSGRDVLNGGSGNDLIFAQDGQFEPTGGDLVTGGAGTDTAETDPKDPVQTVEELLN
jgi:Ca2+-binding RTX toxin-like protein